MSSRSYSGFTFIGLIQAEIFTNLHDAFFQKPNTLLGLNASLDPLANFRAEWILKSNRELSFCFKCNPVVVLGLKIG